MFFGPSGSAIDPSVTLAVTGANSSVGLSLLAHAAERGDIAILAGVRSDRAAAQLPDVPCVTAHIVSYDDAEGLTRAVTGASCAAHLAGILIETKASTYQSANVGSTTAVVEACRAADVRHIVLVSVIGASPDSSNRYLRSKAEAEKVVADSGIPATIIRTPMLLGPGTAGADALVRTAIQGKARLLGGGRYTMRPLDLDDLSRAILRACATPPDGVAVHDLAGPEPITYRELISRFADMMGRRISIGTMPLAVAKLGAAVTSRVRGGGITPTVIEVITANEVVETNADEALGVQLTPLSSTLTKLLPGRVND